MTLALDSFTTFGALLKYLRQRQRLTQRELGLAVGYGDAQINRLERNLRLPDVGLVVAQFIVALHLEDEPLVESGRRKTLPFNGYAEQVAKLYDGMDLVANY